jgi:hypothetical protein
MRISERKDNGAKPSYDVSFEELRLEEITARLNRFKRADERPFEAVSAVSDFNQRAYELFGRPLVKAMTNEYMATLSRQFHPLRFQRWAFSDLNPALWWLAPAAQAVKAQRQPVEESAPARKLEASVSEIMSASLDCYRALRDAVSEASFFQIYGSLYGMYFSDRPDAEAAAPAVEARKLPLIKRALASIDKGGYAEALARVAFLMAHRDEPLPLSRLQLAHDLSRNIASCCRICRATRRVASVASRRSSRATSRTRRSDTARAARETAGPGTRSSPCSSACSPIPACRALRRRTAQKSMLARIRGVLGSAVRRTNLAAR